jgi:hypothetical protein
MATKKAPTLADISTTVENIRATYVKELKEIRDKALKNEQDCASMMTHCRKLAAAAN